LNSLTGRKENNMKNRKIPTRPSEDRLVSLGSDNLVGEKWLVGEDRSRYNIVANLEELIESLAHTRPKWLFVGCDSYSSYGYSNFDVFEGNEYLGSIGVNSLRSDFKYTVDNERMDKKKTRTLRTYSLTTANIKTAKNAVNRNFGAKNAEEQLAELDTTARAGLGSLSAIRYTDYKTAFNKLVELITPAIEKQPELFAAMCPEIDSKVLEDCAEHKHKTDTTKSVNEALRNALGVFIITRGGEYLVKDLAATGGASNTLTSEAIPFEIKRKLGMLKLLPVGATLQDVGYKIADDKFFIVGEGI
jgi:hypothetical protein